MFLYLTVIGKRKETIKSAGTKPWNLFHLSRGGRKWHITGPRPFSAAGLCYGVKTQGRLCCIRQVTENTCKQCCCHWQLPLPTRNGLFLMPGTEIAGMSLPVLLKSTCFMSSYTPRQSFLLFAIAVIYYELVGSGSLILLEISSSCQNAIPSWILIASLPIRTCLFLSFIHCLSMNHPFWQQLGTLKLAFVHEHSLGDLYQTNQTPFCLSIWASR